MKLIGIFLIFLFSSCSFFLNTQPKKDRKSNEYTFSFKIKGWSPVDPDLADHAYKNTTSGDMLILNSFCQKYQSAPLKNLSDNLLSGIQHLNIHSQKKIPFLGREALTTLASGEFDGPVVHIKFTVFRFNQCTYDFIYISYDTQSMKNSTALEEFQSGFKLNRYE